MVWSAPLASATITIAACWIHSQIGIFSRFFTWFTARVRPGRTCSARWWRFPQPDLERNVNVVMLIESWRYGRKKHFMVFRRRLSCSTCCLRNKPARNMVSLAIKSQNFNLSCILWILHAVRIRFVVQSIPAQLPRLACGGQVKMSTVTSLSNVCTEQVTHVGKLVALYRSWKKSLVVVRVSFRLPISGKFYC